MKKFLLLTAIASVASVAAVAPAMADTTTGNFQVNATTVKSCTAPSASTVTISSYDGTAAVAGTTNVVFKCTNSTSATVTLRPANAVAVGTTGTLKNSGAGVTTPITYTLATTNATQLGTGLSGATDITVPVTVTADANQNPIPAIYSDIVGVTVTY